MRSNQRLRILVLGYIVRRPLGGGTWPFLQYATGLHQLGHDVWFLEDSDDYGTCYDPSRHVTDEDPTFGLAFARDVFDRTPLKDRWGYYDAHRDAWHGPIGDRHAEVCAQADLLINVSALNPLRPWLQEVPNRAYIDTDPAFEQIRQLTQADRRSFAAGHTAWFTYGENIAEGTAKVPDDGVAWQATRPPVVLSSWPVTPPPTSGKLTTVMLWDSYEPREYGEYRYAMKSESFAPYFELPKQVDVPLELALGSPNAPRSELRAAGWSVVDPFGPTKDQWTYQRYLAQSRGEFAIAKHGYVVSACGWFSERSAHYLASGRPVITQETGFSRWLETDGCGLMPYSNPEEAKAAVESLAADYAGHCRRAREIATETFDSDRVLARLIDLAMR